MSSWRNASLSFFFCCCVELNTVRMRKCFDLFVARRCALVNQIDFRSLFMYASSMLSHRIELSMNWIPFRFMSASPFSSLNADVDSEGTMCAVAWNRGIVKWKNGFQLVRNLYFVLERNVSNVLGIWDIEINLLCASLNKKIVINSNGMTLSNGYLLLRAEQKGWPLEVRTMVVRTLKMSFDSIGTNKSCDRRAFFLYDLSEKRKPL